MSIADELLKLKSLLDEGAITQEEFDACKTNLFAAPTELENAPEHAPEHASAGVPLSESESPAMQVPEAKPENREKLMLLGAAAGLVVIAVLVVVFAVLPNLKKNVADMPFTIDWGGSTADGTYTGETKRRLPNGTGTFNIKHEDGKEYSLAGEWTDGQVNGYAEEVNGQLGTYKGEFKNNLYHGRGQCYENDVLCFDGDFTDNVPVSLPEFFLYLGGSMCIDRFGSNPDISDWSSAFDNAYDTDWRVFLRENRGIFPDGTSSGNALDFGAVKPVFAPPFKKIMDNSEAYRNQIVCYEGELNDKQESDASNLFSQFDADIDKVTFLSFIDKDRNFYFVIYLGELSEKEGDTVAFAGIPFGSGKGYVESADREVNVVFFVACAVTDDMDELKTAAEANGSIFKTANNSATGWREFLKGYEEWVDAYNALMKKLMNNPADLSSLADYAEMINKTAEWSEDAEKMEDELDDPAELAEYTSEYLRITAKMMNGIAQ